MADKLLMGTARPLLRYESGGVNYRYVLNDQPLQIEIPIPFPEEEIINPGVFSPYTIWKTSKGFRLSCLVSYDWLERVSIETFLAIIESGNSFYLRPHFNFYKEYEVVCLNARSALTRINTVANPYKGALLFTGKENITTHPISQGAFNFDGSTKVANTLAATLNGDCSVEMWIKTPSAFSAQEELFSMASAGVTWTVSIKTDGTIEFVTDDGSANTYNNPALELSVNTWHFLTIGRVNTDVKMVCIDGVCDGTTDSKAANAITATTLGAAANAFSGQCQIYRIYNDDLVTGVFPDEHMIEMIDGTYEGNIKLWWDFSQGNATDLSDEENDGTVTGTSAYSKESFPDTGAKVLT